MFELIASSMLHIETLRRGLEGRRPGRAQAEAQADIKMSWSAKWSKVVRRVIKVPKPPSAPTSPSPLSHKRTQAKRGRQKKKRRRVGQKMCSISCGLGALRLMDGRDWRNGAGQRGGGGECGRTGVGFYERPGVDLWSCGLFKVETPPTSPSPSPSPTKICCEIFYNFIFWPARHASHSPRRKATARGGGVLQLK